MPAFLFYDVRYCLKATTLLTTTVFEELGKQNPFVLVSASDLTNKCVSGEFPIIGMGGHGTGFRANQKGAGLKLVFPPEGWAASGYSLVILAHAPHPNASKLFVDFFHSEVGQKYILEKGLL